MHDNLEYSKTKAISNSSLNLLEISPKQFLKFYNQEIEESEEKHFVLGSAIHCYVLEPDEFDKRYKFMDVTIPNSSNKKQFLNTYLTSKGKDKERLIKAYKDSYVSSTTKEEDILIKAKELKKELNSYIKSLKYKDEGIKLLPNYMRLYFNNLIKELNTNILAKELLFTEISELTQDIEIYNELPIYWEYSNYKLKALLDRVIIDHDNKIIKLVDLKTTKSINGLKTESFFKFNYNRQLSYYSYALINFFEQKYTDKNIEDYTIEHYIIAVNKEADVESAVFKVSNQVILEASKQIRKLLDTAIWHLDNNKWNYSKEHYINGYETI